MPHRASLEPNGLIMNAREKQATESLKAFLLGNNVSLAAYKWPECSYCAMSASDVMCGN